MCIFFGVSRSGYYAWTKYADKEDPDKQIGEYIHFYNYELIQLKIKLTPYEKTMSVSRNNEFLRANQSYSTNGFSILCLLPWVHSTPQPVVYC